MCSFRYLVRGSARWHTTPKDAHTSPPWATSPTSSPSGTSEWTSPARRRARSFTSFPTASAARHRHACSALVDSSVMACHSRTSNLWTGALRNLALASSFLLSSLAPQSAATAWPGVVASGFSRRSSLRTPRMLLRATLQQASTAPTPRSARRQLGSAPTATTASCATSRRSLAALATACTRMAPAPTTRSSTRPVLTKMASPLTCART